MVQPVTQAFVATEHALDENAIAPRRSADRAGAPAELRAPGSATSSTAQASSEQPSRTTGKRRITITNQLPHYSGR